MDNKVLLDIAGHGTIYKYFDKVNYWVYSLTHTMNYCNNTKSEYGNLQKPKEISRISTVGFGNVEENEEKLLFPLDNITETGYIISINEEDLANDINLLPNIKAMVGENKQLERETSFAIWSTTEDTNYYYTKHYTHFIQEEK